MLKTPVQGEVRGADHWGAGSSATLACPKTLSERDLSVSGVAAADHLARHRAGRLAVGQDHLPAHDSVLVTFGALHEPFAISRESENDFRCVRTQPIEIDQ